MQAAVGDRLHIHGHNVGDPDKKGENDGVSFIHPRAPANSEEI